MSDLKTKEDLDYLLDTTALNKRMVDGKDNPFRWRVGTFHIPKGMSKEQKEKASKLACDKFIQAMARQGWELKSKIQIYGPYPAFDLVLQVPLLDMEEIRIRGIFATEPKPVRIEVPPELVRRDPEHKISLNEALKATGIKPVPRKQG